MESLNPAHFAIANFNPAMGSHPMGAPAATAAAAEKPPLPILSDIAFPDLALDSHLIGGHAPAAHGLSLVQHLDGLQAFIQQQHQQQQQLSQAIARAAASPSFQQQGMRLQPAPLAGTSTENPLHSIIIGKTAALGQLSPAPQQQVENSNLPSPESADLMQTGAMTAGENRRHRKPPGAPRGPRTRGADRSPRSSTYRGVTKHRRSGRYEAHIWVKELGRQVYLGGYECEEHAAEAYDIAALKSKGTRTKTNFELSKYADLLGCIDRMTMEELVMAVRRQSQGFSRGTSSFRGVTHHPSGRWEARIGIPGSKHVYLGLFTDEREAARAYDRALVRLRGRAAATNFALGDYRQEMGDYYRMQSRMLHNDPRFADIASSAALFERWIKAGCEGFPDLASPGGTAQPAVNAAVPVNIPTQSPLSMAAEGGVNSAGPAIAALIIQQAAMEAS